MKIKLNNSLQKFLPISKIIEYNVNPSVCKYYLLALFFTVIKMYIYNEMVLEVMSKVFNQSSFIKMLMCAGFFQEVSNYNAKPSFHK